MYIYFSMEFINFEIYKCFVHVLPTSFYACSAGKLDVSCTSVEMHGFARREAVSCTSGAVRGNANGECMHRQHRASSAEILVAEPRCAGRPSAGRQAPPHALAIQSPIGRATGTLSPLPRATSV